MTTKPKAKKFRIRRDSPLAAGLGKGAAATPEEAPTADPAPRRDRPADRSAADTLMSGPTEDGFGQDPYPTARAAQDARVDEPEVVRAEDDIAAIRKEGLTGRQLRMARRLAQKHGIAATSDFDAVRQLRARGIDPFERANMLELVVPSADGRSGPRVQLPQTVDPDLVPSTERAAPPPPIRPQSRDIADIRRDIARRRRRKLALLAVRLTMFVALPTALAGYYFFAMATPMYATKTEFVIQQADSASPGALGGLFSGTGFATSQDSIAVQSYLQSRDAMLRLDEELGYKDHFSQPWIDPIQRLPDGATNEEAYGLYQDNVKIGYDPTEGIVKMEVIAAEPEVSAEYAGRLIAYAEERVDNLTQRLREDQMAGARDSFEEAEAKMMAAQARVLELQEQLGVLDPASESASVMSQISVFETELRQKRLELAQLLSNRRPNQARVEGVEGDIARLEALVAELRADLTDGSGSTSSLARVTSELRVAEVDLQTRTLMMQQALQQLETARIEANRQVRYLSLGVTPVAPDEPTYPRAFENTLLSFLVFAGIYLMISLTASILREQVSA
ncbi:capsule biosynthesis protein [Rhodobacteraceae bacterium CCMM004]|nr:capsule biosynthesis protein [Rhodobacteraceae bacterium CCMM004]